MTFYVSHELHTYFTLASFIDDFIPVSKFATFPLLKSDHFFFLQYYLRCFQLSIVPCSLCMILLKRKIQERRRDFFQLSRAKVSNLDTKCPN